MPSNAHGRGKAQRKTRQAHRLARNKCFRWTSEGKWGIAAADSLAPESDESGTENTATSVLVHRFHSLIALDELAVRQVLNVDHFGQVVLQYDACIGRRRWRRAGVCV